MKYIKLLLASMFTFTAVIKSADVGTCGGRRHRYTGIVAHYQVKNGAGVIVDQDVVACGANWLSLKDSIKFDLRARQLIVEDTIKEQREELRIKQEAKEVVGAEIRGE